MSYIFLIAVKSDESRISCYEQGDLVRIDNTETITLPVVATKCSNETTFVLKHYDHFVEQNEFLSQAKNEKSISGGMLAQDLKPPQQAVAGISSWWLAAGAVVVVAGGIVGYRYLSAPVEKTFLERLNPWSRPTTRGRRLMVNATETVKDISARIEPTPGWRVIDQHLLRPQSIPAQVKAQVLGLAIGKLVEVLRKNGGVPGLNTGGWNYEPGFVEEQIDDGLHIDVD
ncbi:MAG: hypothetical protein M1813_008599 [Trichoglossum hirsutum]|nr:MAG: hypothetical protein M1813_008599 [Trichoglossum hirsutum]